jgi:hypothetical protein
LELLLAFALSPPSIAFRLTLAEFVLPLAPGILFGATPLFAASRRPRCRSAVAVISLVAVAVTPVTALIISPVLLLPTTLLVLALLL